MDKILKDMNLVTEIGENNSLTNIYKKMVRPPNIEQQHIKVPEEGYIYQADLLFLPTDQGYKYLLVMVDNCDNACDFQPMKEKTAKETLKAILEIFERPYLKRPKFSIEVDAGTEFQAEFKAYFEPKKPKPPKESTRKKKGEVTAVAVPAVSAVPVAPVYPEDVPDVPDDPDNPKGVYIRQGKAGRHRQQSLVENLNKIIGRVIHMQLTQDDIDDNVDTSHQWISMLPQLRISLNKHLHRNKSKITKQMTLKKCKGELIPIGTVVRIALDNPKSITGKTLHGPFRASDPRFEAKTRTVTSYILRPDQPPMYIISGIKNCVFMRYQLQVVDENEVRPNRRAKQVEPEPQPEPQPEPEHEADKLYEVEKLLSRKTVKGKIYFRVKWKGDAEITEETRASLNKQVPAMVAEFEHTHKKK